jgi:hypothetical protein
MMTFDALTHSADIGLLTHLHMVEYPQAGSKPCGFRIGDQLPVHSVLSSKVFHARVVSFGTSTVIIEVDDGKTWLMSSPQSESDVLSAVKPTSAHGSDWIIREQI